MTLGSVVLSILRNAGPLAVRRAGYGRVAIGFGATAVTVPPALALHLGRGRFRPAKDRSSTRCRRRGSGVPRQGVPAGSRVDTTSSASQRFGCATGWL